VITLIDLSAEFWRNYFGTGSALTGYDKTMERVDWYSRENPGQVIVCCDHPDKGQSKRIALSADYKAQRKPLPSDGIQSLQAAQQRLGAWGLPVVSAPGYEADDLIATLCDQAWPERVQVLGCEKDFYALLSDRIRLIGPNGPIDAADCVRKFGVEPERMTELLALVGDASDNVKGCDGIGLVKAQAILGAYGSIAAAKLAAQDGSMKLTGIGKVLLANLAAWDPTLALSLVTLMRDAPVSLTALLSGEQEFPELATEPSAAEESRIT
jgi:DNA polymerase-1